MANIFTEMNICLPLSSNYNSQYHLQTSVTLGKKKIEERKQNFFSSHSIVLEMIEIKYS